ncbi:dipeptide ABC transporter ATP-binding protein [Acuticoccus mangrovi]|uniref:ABC transporter ATP-binding protein n=1 Tax=Acuticoccus mangrovi TaxID=2796142 RepID=A0A934IJ04_9HYPH|nr:ABC transporter ATP-binding protein [Acuticoccus mangrovi]MBJ3775876.1 ABC transporter ATP-binding protein [Acuticoccus mangrovi]
MTDSPLLSVRDLTVYADETMIVEAVTFDLRAGETLAVVGESGSGKSTLALAVTGLLPPGLHCEAGAEVRFDGVRLPLEEDRAMRALRGTRIGMVFQDPMNSLNPFMRVASQLAEALGRVGVPARERQRRIAALLREVELGPELAHRYPHQLSGGQQQRVMIAMALAGSPDLLVADEPTSALDTTTTGEIVGLLSRLRRERGMALLFISHDLGLAADADAIMVMRRGRVVETGAAASVLSAPREDYTRELVAARRLLAEARPTAASGEAPVLASVDGLAVDYPARRLFAPPTRVLHDVSATLRAGRTLGVLGRSGSGKSTFAQALAAMQPPSAGTVRLLGAALTPLDATLPRRERRAVQFVFQNPQGALNPRLTVARALAEPLRLAGRLDGLDEAVARALREVGLSPAMAARFPHQLSGGQRQRVCIARALLCDPKILICDEVVSALDMTVQAEILALLARLQRERGFAMVFIGHDIEVVRWIADEIVVMHQGEVVDRCTAATLGAPDRHEETRRLLAHARPLVHAADIATEERRATA